MRRTMSRIAGASGARDGRIEYCKRLCAWAVWPGAGSSRPPVGPPVARRRPAIVFCRPYASASLPPFAFLRRYLASLLFLRRSACHDVRRTVRFARFNRLARSRPTASARPRPDCARTAALAALRESDPAAKAAAARALYAAVLDGRASLCRRTSNSTSRRPAGPSRAARTGRAAQARCDAACNRRKGARCCCTHSRTSNSTRSIWRSTPSGASPACPPRSTPTGSKSRPKRRITSRC